MQPLFIIVITIFCLCQLSVAAPRVFKEHNFSLELSTNWQVSGTPPPQAVLAAHSSDGSKNLIVVATKIPAEKLPTAGRDMVASAKQSAIDKGWKITDEQETLLDGVPFYAFITQIPTNMSVVTYIGVAGNEGYMLQGLSRTANVGSDPDIKAAVESFQLLSPVEVAKPIAPKPVIPPESSGYRAGTFVGKIFFFAVLVGGIVWLVKRTRKKRSEGMTLD